MNKLSKRIIPAIVASREAWEHTRKHGWKLKTAFVEREYTHAREALFYDEVYFPKMKRMLTWMRTPLFNIMPDADWQPLDMGYNQTVSMLYPNDTLCQEWIDEAFGPYFQAIFEGEEWGWEEPSEKNIWAEIPKPGFVSEQLVLIP